MSWIAAKELKSYLVFAPSVVVPGTEVVVLASTPPSPEAIVFVTALSKILAPEVAVPSAPNPAAVVAVVAVP